MTEVEQWSPSDIPLAAEGASTSPVPLQVRRRLRAEEPASPADSSASSVAAGANDEICRRLQDAVEKCQAHYTAWKKGNGESDLSESLHELRRAVARIEIEIAASHSSDSALRPIPIPLHRAHK